MQQCSWGGNISLEVPCLRIFTYKTRSCGELCSVSWAPVPCLNGKGIGWRIDAAFCLQKGWRNGRFQENIGNSMRTENTWDYRGDSAQDCTFKHVRGSDIGWEGTAQSLPCRGSMPHGDRDEETGSTQSPLPEVLREYSGGTPGSRKPSQKVPSKLRPKG